MPVERCQRGGRAGFRWGAGGFCYLGPDARERATRQGRAIEAAKRARADAVTTGRALAALRRSLGVDPKVEARYRRRLVERVKRLSRVVSKAIDARLRRLGDGIDERARAAGRRVDGGARFTLAHLDTAASDLDELRGVLRVTEREWDRDNPIRDDIALDVGRAVERSATESTARAVERIARVKIEVPGPEGTDRALAAFARRNVDLIKTIDRRHFADVEKVVVDALTMGRRTRDLRRDIAARFGVSERRAQLIARDQLASLNTQITRARQEDLGIARYRWTTSGDDRVREEHEAIDGEVFTWAEGHPEEGHPGEPINCRCVAVPVFEADDITAGLVEEAEAAAREAGPSGGLDERVRAAAEAAAQEEERATKATNLAETTLRFTERQTSPLNTRVRRAIVRGGADEAREWRDRITEINQTIGIARDGIREARRDLLAKGSGAATQRASARLGEILARLDEVERANDGHLDRLLRRLRELESQAAATRIAALNATPERIAAARAAVFASDEPSRIPRGTINRTGRTKGTRGAAEFRRDMRIIEDAVSSIPEPLLRALRKTTVIVTTGRKFETTKGFRLHVGTNMTQIHHRLRGVQPRGWPPGSTWAEVGGGASHGTASIAVRPGGTITRAGRLRHVVLHETGHAVDATITGTAVGKRLVDDDWFVDAWRQAVADGSMRRWRVSPGYFLQDPPAGPQEWFAEIMADAWDSPASRAKVDSVFPGLLDRIALRIAEAHGI